MGACQSTHNKKRTQREIIHNNSNKDKQLVVDPEPMPIVPKIRTKDQFETLVLCRKNNSKRSLFQVNFYLRISTLKQRIILKYSLSFMRYVFLNVSLYWGISRMIKKSLIYFSSE